MIKSINPYLDLSKVTMDDPLPSTSMGDDTIREETNDFTQSEQDPKNDGVILAQLAVEKPLLPRSHLRKILLMILKTLLLRTPRILFLKTTRILQLKMSRTLQFSFFIFSNNLCISSYFKTILSALLFLGLACKYFTLFMVYCYYFVSITFSIFFPICSLF